MEAGLRLLQQYTLDLLYLSLTDYIQHKHAPGTPEADRFYQTLDGYFNTFDALGAVVGLTADHGMNDKNDAAGRPNIMYLCPWLDAWVGSGTTRVILPITDPYVVHHGALGSFATVYVDATVDILCLIARLKTVAGLEYVGTRAEACQDSGLPADRIGDVVVTGDCHTVLGKAPQDHDLRRDSVPEENVYGPRGTDVASGAYHCGRHPPTPCPCPDGTAWHPPPACGRGRGARRTPHGPARATRRGLDRAQTRSL